MCRPAVLSLHLRPMAAGASHSLPSTSGRGTPPAQLSFATRRRIEGRGAVLYQQALTLARDENYAAARAVFEEVVAVDPNLTKAWVSYAQMEKRVCKCAGETGAARFRRCREVLQRAMTINPTCPELAQAWGLMELQKGNIIAAVKLLERSAKQDPRNLPVLRWKLVRDAQVGVQSMRSRAAQGAQ